MQGRHENLILVHTPAQASRANQAEVCFSVLQHKPPTPSNFGDLETLQRPLLAFGCRYEEIAAPFEWKFTRKDLQKVLDRLDERDGRAPARSMNDPDVSLGGRPPRSRGSTIDARITSMAACGPQGRWRP